MSQATSATRAAWTALLLALGACEQAPIAPVRGGDLRPSEQVFAILCRRLARESAPLDPTGLAYAPACNGGDAGSLLGHAATPALTALVEQRGRLVAALDRALGEGESRDALGAFEKADGDGGELDQFLYRLVPFYDGPIPRSTRSLGQLLGTLAAADDPRSAAVLAYLQRIATHRGYRPAGTELDGVRALLGYPRIDKLLGAVGRVTRDGAGGEAAFRALLEAAALELADAPGSEPLASWLEPIAELLLDAPVPAAPGDAAVPSQGALSAASVYTVVRGDGASAVGTGASPFPVAGEPDPDAALRRPDGRLDGFRYRDTQATLLHALATSQVGLWRPDESGVGALPRMAGALTALLGPAATRSYAFHGGRVLSHVGSQLAESPVLDLVHALATMLTLPETDALLAVLREQLRTNESSLMGGLWAALEVDRLADAHPEAAVTGWDGTTASRTEFWDDLFSYVQSLLDRPGMLESVLRVYARPGAAAQVALLAKLMEHNDEVTYPGARIPAEDQHSDADVARFNAPIHWQLSSVVDRTKGDVGMNRSLFQRLLSTVASVRGLSFCNKEGAVMSVPDPTSPGGTLMFPNPGAQPGANALLTSVVNLVCPPASQALSYPRCALVQHPNIAEAHIRTILGRLELKLKDPQLRCLMETGLAGDVGAQIEQLAQIDGYSLSPTAQAFTRYTYVGPNAFVQSLSTPQLTNDGVLLTDYEPNYSFVLEAPQDDILLDGKPASFMDVAKDIGTAFDDHEYFEETENGKVATRGYRYVDLLHLFHMHWPSARTTDCPAEFEPGNEGCTQRLDPTRPFYSKQSSFATYEPLMIEAERTLQLGQRVVDALAGMARVWVASDATGAARVVAAGTPGARDGVTVLSEFVAAMVSPRPHYTYRDGHHQTASNACTPQLTPEGTVTCEGGRGRVIEQTSPVYLLLDAIHQMDVAWARPENRARHERWLAGRSAAVDALLTVERAREDRFQLRDRQLVRSALTLLDWLLDVQLGQRHPLGGDRAAWAIGEDGLARRLERVLAHPLMRPATSLVDALAADDTAARELSRMLAQLLDRGASPDTFTSLVTASADTLEYLRRDRELAPLGDLLALSVAPDALTAALPGAAPPSVGDGAAYATMELVRELGSLAVYADTTPSPMAKLLANLAARDGQGETALEALYDVALTVNRVDPRNAGSTPLTPDDMRSVLSAARHFLLDDERGLERLYAVIAERDGAATGRTP
jgi:hypothetical protein